MKDRKPTLEGATCVALDVEANTRWWTCYERGYLPFFDTPEEAARYRTFHCSWDDDEDGDPDKWRTDWHDDNRDCSTQEVFRWGPITASMSDFLVDQVIEEIRDSLREAAEPPDRFETRHGVLWLGYDPDDPLPKVPLEPTEQRRQLARAFIGGIIATLGFAMIGQLERTTVTLHRPAEEPTT